MNSKPASDLADLQFEATAEDVEALRRHRPVQVGVNLLELFERSFPLSFFVGIPPRTETSEGWPEFEL